MKLKYEGPSAAVQIAATGQTVERGETVEVAAAVGRELVKQDIWKKIEPKKEKE